METFDETDRHIRCCGKYDSSIIHKMGEWYIQYDPLLMVLKRPVTIAN